MTTVGFAIIQVDTKRLADRKPLSEGTLEKESKYFDKAHAYFCCCLINAYYGVALIAGEQVAGWMYPEAGWWGAVGESWEALLVHLPLARLGLSVLSAYPPGLCPVWC